MTDPTPQPDFAQMIKELGQASHSSYVLASSTALDDALQTAILMKMRHDLSNSMKDRLFENYGPISSGAAKIDIAYALSIIDDAERSDFRLVKDIRNEFAHPKERMHFDHPSIDEKLRNLPATRRRAKNQEAFNELISGCFKHLADQIEMASLVNALLNYTPAPQTSPETSEPPPHSHPDQD